MKKLTFLLLASTLLMLAACRKEKIETPPVEETKEFSNEIYSIIPEAYIDSIKAKGMVLHPGNNPPELAGIFHISPVTLFATTGPSDPWPQGYVINDYKYRFYEYSSGQLKVDYKQIDGGDDEAFGLGAYVSGSGNKFTVFAQLVGSGNGIAYKQAAVISGEITAGGIKDFKYAFVLVDKTGDELNQEMIPVGASRIWIDADAVSPLASEFRPTTSVSGNNNFLSANHQ